jgi:hypothetical protein
MSSDAFSSSPAFELDEASIRREIVAMGSSLAAHEAVIDVFLEESTRWLAQLGAHEGALRGEGPRSLSREEVADCRHEIANGMAISGAVDAGRWVRGLELRVREDPAAALADLLAMAVEALRATERVLLGMRPV